MHWLLWALIIVVAIIAIAFVYLIFFAKSASEYLKIECKKRVDGELAAFKTEDWGVIVGAPYAAFDTHPCNDYKVDHLNDDALESAWGITNRETLVNQLFSLLMGGHSADYYALRENVLNKSEDEFKTLIAEINHLDLDQNDKKELIWQHNMMYKNVNNIQSVQYIAWDYVRFSMLCLSGCKGGFITEEEAKTWTLMLAPKLQQTYTSWKELWDSFVVTRWFWSAEDENWTSSQCMYNDLVNVLLTEQGSPATSIAWSCTLPVVGISSFVNAIVSIDSFDEEEKTQLEDALTSRLVHLV